MRARLAIALAALAATLAGPAPALGHAVLAGSDPADGGALALAPRTATLTFTEPALASETRVSLVDVAGRSLSGTPGATAAPFVCRVIDAPADGDAGQRSVTVALPPLGAGVYRLSWSTVGREDLHATAGSIVFGVGEAGQGAAALAGGDTGARGADGVEAAVRGADLVALALAVGLLPLLAGVAGPLGFGQLRRLARGVAFGATVALATGSALLVLRADVAHRSVLELAAPGGVEQSFGVRQLALVALLLAAVAILRDPRRSALALVGLAVAPAIALALTANGHAAAVSGLWSVDGVAAAVHALAALTWAGGLAGLALLGTEGLRRARRVVPAALVVTTALAATGLHAAGLQVATVSDLDSAYGHALLVKLALVAGSAALGAACLVASRRARRPRLLAADALVACAILLVAGVLTASAPARGPAGAAVPPGASERTTVAAADLLVTVALRPNRPGANFVDVTVADTRRPAPAPVTAVDVDLATRGGATPTTTARTGAGGVLQPGSVLVDAPGVRDLLVRVHRPGLPDATARATWVVGSGAAADAPAAAGRPLDALVAPPAAALAALAVGLALVAWARRRPGSIPGRGWPAWRER